MLFWATMTSVSDRYPLTYEDLLAFCARQDLRHRGNDERGQVAILYQILQRDAPLYLITRPERGMLSVVLGLPFAIPPERRPYIGEALTRLNASAYMGTWVMNIATGEVYFRVTLPTLGVQVQDQTLLFVLRLVVSTVESMAPALRRITDEDISAADLFGPPEDE